MKNRMKNLLALAIAILFTTYVYAEDQERDVPSFSKISLRISAKVYVEQGDKQSVEIVAKSSTLQDIITEVKDHTLHIRFPNNVLLRRYEPGKIEIYITVPEVDGLTVSGSGDIIAEKINTRILDLTMSGSGNILIEDLSAERVSSVISGSGEIKIEDGNRLADDLSVNISGSGNMHAQGFEVRDAMVRIAGSGNCTVSVKESINAKIAGSGNVFYKGNPSVESSIAGSGKVKKL